MSYPEYGMKMHKKFLRPVIKNQHQEQAESRGAYSTAHANRFSIGFAAIRRRGQKERVVAILEIGEGTGRRFAV